MKIRGALIVCCCLIICGGFYFNISGCGNNGQFTVPQQDETQPEETAQPVQNPPPPPVQTSTAEYWVSTEGSDDNPGTEELPFRTLAKAADEAYYNPKDIYVFPGTYHENAWITVQDGVSIYGLSARTTDPSLYPTVVDFSQCPEETCGISVVESTTDEESTIDSLTIVGKGIGLSIGNNASPTITNNDISAVGIGDYAYGVALTSAGDGSTSAAVIEKNRITTGDANGANGVSVGISFLGHGTSTLAPQIIDNTITSGNATVLSGGIEGWAWTTSNVNLTISDNAIFSGTAGQTTAGILLSGSAGTQARIERNRIVAGSIDGTSPDRRSYGILAYDIGDTLLVSNNFIYGGRDGLWSDAMDLDNCPDSLIYFNSIHAGNGTDSTIGIALWGTTQAAMMNNILCSEPGVTVGVNEQDSNVATMSNNLFCEDWTTLYEGNPSGIPQTFIDVADINVIGIDFAGNVEGDPKFENMANQDYHLTDNSDALDIAVEIVGVDQDIERGDRIKGSAPDMGAHEYP